MGTSFTFIIYQNQLCAEGLEAILEKNNYNVFKSAAKDFNGLTHDNRDKIELVIIENNWPFPKLETNIEEYKLFFGRYVKTILVPNIINKSIFRLVNDGKIHGVVLKGSNTDELLFAMKQVAEDKSYYSSLVANVYLKNNFDPYEIKVSKREKQILSLLSEMLSTHEIANQLSITKSTVKTHRRNLMRKFNAKNMLCLLRQACRENLLDEENYFCQSCYKQFIGE